MKKCRFLWSAHRITERQKAGKSRSIKGKQLKNSRNTVSKQLVALRSSASADLLRIYAAKPGTARFRAFFVRQKAPKGAAFGGGGYRISSS